MTHHHYCQRCDCFTFHIATLSAKTGLAQPSERCPLCLTSADQLPMLEIPEDPQLSKAYYAALSAAQAEAREINARLLSIPIVHDLGPMVVNAPPRKEPTQ